MGHLQDISMGRSNFAGTKFLFIIVNHFGSRVEKITKYEVLGRFRIIFILKGILACDLVGFHINDYCLNFLDCCQRSLGLRVDRYNKKIYFIMNRETKKFVERNKQ